MKSILATFVALLFVSASVFAGPKPTGNIDLKKSVLNWKGYKVTGSHTGTVGFKSGSLDFSGNMLKGGSFVIDMASIACTDLEGKGKASLEGHLKSDDFFGVEKSPTAKIEITKVVSRGKPGDYKIVANLTIKNITKEIKFDAKVADGKATAKIVVDRSEFDVKYGSGSFFENLADNTIYDEFDIDINVAY